MADLRQDVADAMQDLQDLRQDMLREFRDIKATNAHLIQKNADAIQDFRDEFADNAKQVNLDVDNLVMRTSKGNLPSAQNNHVLFQRPTGASKRVTSFPLTGSYTSDAILSFSAHPCSEAWYQTFLNITCRCSAASTNCQGRLPLRFLSNLYPTNESKISNNK